MNQKSDTICDINFSCKTPPSRVARAPTSRHGVLLQKLLLCRSPRVNGDIFWNLALLLCAVKRAARTRVRLGKSHEKTNLKTPNCKTKLGVAPWLWAITQQGRERTQSPPNGSEWHRSAPSAKDLCQNSQSKDEQDVSERQSIKDADAEDATLRQAKTFANSCHENDGGAGDTSHLGQ